MKNMCKKLLDENKLVIDCFLVYHKEEGDNIVLVNSNEDKVIVLDDNFSWKYSYNKSDGFAIHMKDKENKVDINIEHATELNNGDILELSNKWTLDIM